MLTQIPFHSKTDVDDLFLDVDWISNLACDPDGSIRVHFKDGSGTTFYALAPGLPQDRPYNDPQRKEYDRLCFEYAKEVVAYIVKTSQELKNARKSK